MVDRRGAHATPICARIFGPDLRAGADGCKDDDRKPRRVHEPADYGLNETEWRSLVARAMQGSAERIYRPLNWQHEGQGVEAKLSHKPEIMRAT
jgi:hypothetical protein